MDGGRVHDWQGANVDTAHDVRHIGVVCFLDSHWQSEARANLSLADPGTEAEKETLDTGFCDVVKSGETQKNTKTPAQLPRSMFHCLNL